MCYWGYAKSPKSWKLCVKGLESCDSWKIGMMNMENDILFKCSPMVNCCIIPRWRHGDCESALLLPVVCCQTLCDLQIEEGFQHE